MTFDVYDLLVSMASGVLSGFSDLARFFCSFFLVVGVASGRSTLPRVIAMLVGGV